MKKQNLILKGMFALLFFFSVLPFEIIAQVDPIAEGKKNFDSRNYKVALRYYLDAYKANQNDLDINSKIAQCYLNSNIDKSKALPYIEFVTKQAKFEPENLFFLGKAYHHSLKFDEAIAAYQRYIAAMEKKEKEIKAAQREIEICNNAKSIVKNPLNVSFENAGRKVNSEFADYYPFTPGNGSLIVFTTRRKGNTGGVIDMDGYYTSEIYISEFKNASWSKSKNIGVKLNTDYDEEAVGLSNDGKNLIVYIDHEDTYGDLYLSKWEKSGYQLAVDVGPTVNTNKLETAGFTNSDNSILLFSTFKSGGNGGSDIWMAKKLPNGEWGIAENLGTEINTPYDEDFPIISDDGKTLHFASNGHNTMGGFDVFTSTWDETSGKWSTPKNLGYPINDTYDNMVVSFLDNGREAYLSTFRNDSYGDLDIYMVTFNNVEPKQSVLQVKAFSGDTSKVNPGVKLTVNALPGNSNYGSYKTKKNGTAAVVLDAGKYSITAEANGFKTVTKEIAVDNKRVFTEKIPFQIIMEGTATAEPKKDSKTKTGDKKKEATPEDKSKTKTKPKKG
jgi:tetratricopeptide (TPR) repeat protein